MEPELPFEFYISGTAMSLQASNASRATWKSMIEAAARDALPEGAWLLSNPLAVTIYIFPDGPLAGDVDNRIKPILDGMNRCIYDDDQIIERIVAQKFEPEKIFIFNSPSSVLSAALDADKPLVYIKISEDLNERVL